MPELQITHDLSVAGYMNYMRNIVTVNTTRDIQQDYSAEKALATRSGGAGRAHEPAAVLRDDAGRAEDADRRRGDEPGAFRRRSIRWRRRPPRSAPAAAASAPAPVATNQAAIDAAKLDRVYLAVYMSLASPDYLIQK